MKVHQATSRQKTSGFHFANDCKKEAAVTTSTDILPVCLWPRTCTVVRYYPLTFTFTAFAFSAFGSVMDNTPSLHTASIFAGSRL